MAITTTKDTNIMCEIYETWGLTFTILAPRRLGGGPEPVVGLDHTVRNFQNKRKVSNLFEEQLEHTRGAFFFFFLRKDVSFLSLEKVQYHSDYSLSG